MNDRRYRILYEDESLIVADKQSGVLVIPSPGKDRNTLTSLINAYLDQKGVEVNAYPCHRIDRETSGVIVFAKGKKTQQLVMDEFKFRRVKKRYVAFVDGALDRDAGTISKPIYNKNKFRDENATTRYRVLERRKGFTVVEVEPITGRTNQIRIHFKSIGHPLLGERVYAFRKDFKIKFKRLALHAEYIELLHPMTKKNVSFEAPLPDDMRATLQ